MYPFSIVKMDIFCDCPCHFLVGLVLVTAGGFCFQAPEKTLHHSIIPTVPLPAHTGLNMQLGELILVGMAGILASLVRME